jgi:hypothetical protein
MGQMEMEMKIKCMYQMLEKNISILVNVTQVSDVAHWPLV